jgi:hypothetical protein
MESAGCPPFAWPNVCPCNNTVKVSLPERQLMLCMCKRCKTIWLEGAHGAAGFSASELLSLARLRKRHRSRQ